MRLPNFFLAGVPKAGSTSLHRCLRQHPQIYVNAIKEPMFFATPDLEAREGRYPTPPRDDAALRAYLDGPQRGPAQLWVRDWEDYRRLFRDVRDEVAVGDTSVTYFWTPGAAERIACARPDARILFVLRDPADRLFSWYLVALRRDPRPGLTFRAWLDRALASEEEHAASLGAGRYATHLGRFLERFPRGRILVLPYEELCADPRAVLRRMFEFLGVDPDHPIDVSRRHNETLVARAPALDRLRPLGRALPRVVRRVLRPLWFRPRGRLAPSAEDRRAVIELYRDEIVRTGDLTGLDVEGWLR